MADENFSTVKSKHEPCFVLFVTLSSLHFSIFFTTSSLVCIFRTIHEGCSENILIYGL